MILRNKHLALCAFLAAALFSSSLQAQDNAVPKASRNDFKFTLLSLGSGSTRVTYERAFSELNSAELTLGFVGLGWDWINHSDPEGFLVKLAYKWRLIPQRSSSSWLAGFYVKPEFVAASFDYQPSSASLVEPPQGPSHTTRMALLAECGYQVVAGWFLFDVYAGLGPSVGTGNDNNYYHSFMLFPADGWMAFTAGFRVGAAF